jgi:hypothetical protein
MNVHMRARAEIGQIASVGINKLIGIDALSFETDLTHQQLQSTVALSRYGFFGFHFPVPAQWQASFTL